MQTLDLYGCTGDWRFIYPQYSACVSLIFSLVVYAGCNEKLGVAWGRGKNEQRNTKGLGTRLAEKPLLRQDGTMFTMGPRVVSFLMLVILPIVFKLGKLSSSYIYLYNYIIENHCHGNKLRLQETESRYVVY